MRLPTREKSPDIESVNEETLEETSETKVYLQQLKEMVNSENP